MRLPDGRVRKLRRSSDDAMAAHTLTFSCFRRRPFPSWERTCLWLVDALDRARKHYALDAWAYMFMPNRVQLILWPRTDRMLTRSTAPDPMLTRSTARACHPPPAESMPPSASMERQGTPVLVNDLLSLVVTQR